MLGAISGAQVELFGDESEEPLAVGTTRADGSWGPLEYPGDYDGPILIGVIGDGFGAEYECDNPAGCSFDGEQIAFGSKRPFNWFLTAATSSSQGGQFVSVSLLSDLVVSRAVDAGGLTSSTIEAANSGLLSGLASVIDPVLVDSLGGTLPRSLANLRLIDALRADAFQATEVQAYFSLLNIALLELSRPDETVADFIERLRTSPLGLRGELPVGGQDSFEVATEQLLAAQETVLAAVASDDDLAPFRAALESAVAPADIAALTAAVDDALGALQRVVLDDADEIGIALNITEDDPAASPLFEFEVRLEGGLTARTESLSVTVSDAAPWLAGELVDGPQGPLLRVSTIATEIAALDNGSYNGIVSVRDNSGDFASAELPVSLQLALEEISVAAPSSPFGSERADVQLALQTNRPSGLRDVFWNQLSGSTATVSIAELGRADITLPSVPQDESLPFEVEVVFATGERFVLPFTLMVEANLNVADVVVTDGTLQRCIDSLAATDPFLEANLVTELNCASDVIRSLAGLEVFTGLETLRIPLNELSLPDALVLERLPGISSFDLSQGVAIPCQVTDAALRNSMSGGGFFLDPGDCVRLTVAPLWGDAVDYAPNVNPSRSLAYVADRDFQATGATRDGVADMITEVVMNGVGVVNRYLLPAPAAGIDVSAVDRSVYVALENGNSIAVIDTFTGAQEIINLGAASQGASPADVLEIATNRLLVAFADGTGTARIIEFNLLSREGRVVADGLAIDGAPKLSINDQRTVAYVVTDGSTVAYALDLTDPDIGILADTGGESLEAPTRRAVVSEDGSRIALDTGVVLDGNTLMPVGAVVAGPNALVGDSRLLGVDVGNGVVDAYDFESLALTEQFTTRCVSGDGLESYPSSFDGRFPVFLSSGELCYSLEQNVIAGGGRSRWAIATLRDFRLQECVFDFSFPDDVLDPLAIDTLSCGAEDDDFIFSLEGIAAFAGLRTLQLDDTRLTRLTPLAASDQFGAPILQALETVDLEGPILDALPLLELPALRNVMLERVPGLPCEQVDALIGAGFEQLTAPLTCTQRLMLELGGAAGAMVPAPSGEHVLVSVPSAGEVLEVAVATGSVTRRYAVPGAAQGLSLSADGSTLYIAFSDAPTVGTLDLASGTTSTMDVQAALDAPAAWDVLERVTDELIVTGRDEAFVVQVRLDQESTTRRVAGEQRSAGNATVAATADGAAVYVGGDTLLRLDGADADLPVTAQRSDLPDAVAARAVSSQDGRLYAGQILDGESLITQGFLRGLPALVGTDSNGLEDGLVAAPTLPGSTVDVYEAATQRFVRRELLGCEMTTLSDLVYLSGPTPARVSLGDDKLCIALHVTR